MAAISSSANRRRRQIARLNQAFSPNMPIVTANLFANRGNLMDKTFEALGQGGAHAVIYGERGVGKTSFISVMADIYRQVLLTVRVNCTSNDTFSDIWRNVFTELNLEVNSPALGFTDATKKQIVSGSEFLPSGEISPNDVRRGLQTLAPAGVAAIFLDEFDRVSDHKTRSLFADTIKMLSDYGVRVSVVLVGVADSVTGLIDEHQSVSRNLVQIPVPRMAESELGEILDKGTGQAGLRIEPGSRKKIIAISRGLPHYTHALGLYASRNTVRDNRKVINGSDVKQAIIHALENSQEYIQSQYEKAIASAQKANYERVLIACALAPVNDRGSFAPADVRAPLSTIMGKRYEIPNFNSNLSLLASDARGEVLERLGAPRAYRYRFRDPLLQPYVVLRGLEKGVIASSDVLGFE